MIVKWQTAGQLVRQGHPPVYYLKKEQQKTSSRKLKRVKFIFQEIYFWMKNHESQNRLDQGRKPLG